MSENGLRIKFGLVEAIENTLLLCLSGNDQAAAAKQDIPEPDKLNADIETLESRVKTNRGRRKQP